MVCPPVDRTTDIKRETGKNNLVTFLVITSVCYSSANLNRFHCKQLKHVNEYHVSNVVVPSSGVATGGGGGKWGNLPPPQTSDRTPREIDADPRRVSWRKKWG